MRLKAKVKKITGASQHSTSSDSGLVPTPDPAWLEISSDESGTFLIHFNADGQSIADTWHLTVDEAKSQAEFEFEIQDSDWTVIGS
jgi:hypothetical protein